MLNLEMDNSKIKDKVDLLETYCFGLIFSIGKGIGIFFWGFKVRQADFEI